MFKNIKSDSMEAKEGPGQSQKDGQEKRPPGAQEGPEGGQEEARESSRWPGRARTGTNRSERFLGHEPERTGANRNHGMGTNRNRCEPFSADRFSEPEPA